MKTRWISLFLLTATVVLGLATAAQAEVRVSPNYRLNSDSAPFRGQDQPALAVNPNNPQHVVVVNANYLDSTCESSVSLDGGSTWSPAVTLTPPAGAEPFVQFCTNTVGTAPNVQFGTGQNVYTAVAAQRQAAGFVRDATTLLYKSTNGGLTWQGTVAIEGGPGGADPNMTVGPAFYRPAIAVDRGAGTNSQDRLHVVARDLRAPGNGLCPNLTNTCTPIRAAVSEDGGVSFAAPVRVSPAGANITDFPSRPVVNSDHSVTVAWRVAAITGPIQAARWTPQSGQWSAPVDVTIGTNTGTTVPSHVTPGPSTGGSYPRMAGNPVTGKLYIVYSQGSTGPTAPAGGYQGTDHFISPDSQVWFQRSSDNGLTWTQPKRISEQTSFPGSRTHQTRHADISVSPNGRINVVWHDRRHWYQGPGERNCSHSHVFCEDIRLGDTYYSYSTDNGDNFVKPIRVNDRSHNNEVGYDTRPSGYWWFAPQVVTVGNDQRALIAWMDSREGNWETDTEDLYLAKVDFNATGAAPRTHINAPDAVSRSVALSKLGYQGGTEGALVGGARDPANPPALNCVGTNAPCFGGPASRNASSVVIANQGNVAGALAGTVLARANPGPVLLSPAAGLPASVKAEVTRMKPAQAFVIGATGSLSEQVRTDVAAAAGIPLAQVIRISGGSDAAIAADIAARMDYRTAAEKTAGDPAFDAAVIANPASPDAAAVAGLAAARRLPVLYVGSNSIPAETQAALASLNINRTLVIGGASSVSATVLAGLPSPTRLGGANQYETSAAVVAESTARGLPSNVVYVADGSIPMDAALLGGVVARATGMLVLAPAPLHTTATGQASSFGLSGISRFFLLGPPTGGVLTPTAPRYPGPPSSYPGPIAGSSFAGCPSRTANVIRGTGAGTRITGTPAGDRIFAGAGNDVVDALAGNDCIDLGTGADRGQGGRGNDLILSGPGRDRALGSSGRDRIRGGAAADRLEGGSGNDSLLGDSGADRLTGGSGNDRLTGGSGRDRLTGGSGRDNLSSGAGNDRIAARDGKRDRISCGRGRDTVVVDRLDRVSRSCERVRRRR